MGPPYPLSDPSIPLPNDKATPRFVPEERWLLSQRAVGGLLQDRMVLVRCVRELLMSLDVWRKTPGAPPHSEQDQFVIKMALELLSKFDEAEESQRRMAELQRRAAQDAARFGPPRVYCSGMATMANMPTQNPPGQGGHFHQEQSATSDGASQPLG